MPDESAGGVSLGEVVSFISDLGVIGILIALLWGGFKRWWVWGWHYDEACRERDEWKSIALEGSDLAERVAKIAERERGK